MEKFSKYGKNFKIWKNFQNMEKISKYGKLFKNFEKKRFGKDENLAKVSMVGN